MERIILISETYQRARYYLRKHFPDRNPNGSGIYIITQPHQVERLRGIQLRSEDRVIIESHPYDCFGEVLYAIGILESRRIPRPLETKTT